MNEIRKSFYDDVREKKVLKNQVRNTNRTGKGPVRFPSDYLSRKERQGLNSEVSSWNYGYFYDWDTFREKMPDHIKIEYLNHLLNKYGVSLGDISIEVFGKSRTNLMAWLKKHPDVRMYVNVPDQQQKAKKSDRLRLQKDISEFRSESKEPEEPASESADFTREEKDLISKFLAPISEDKTEEEPTDISNEVKKKSSITMLRICLDCDDKYAASEQIWALLDMICDGPFKISLTIDTDLH